MRKKIVDRKRELRFNSQESYSKLLRDKRWQFKRKQILRRDKNTCIVCGSDQSLHVHHKQYHYRESSRVYKKPWDYPSNLLVSLCARCHYIGHKKFKIPTKYTK